jgi:hypothetical protein
MTTILKMLARVAERGRAPRCGVCATAMTLVAEETVPGTPPVLESVFRCGRCGISSVRCLVAGALD